MSRFSPAVAVLIIAVTAAMAPARVAAGAVPTCFGHPATIVGPNTERGSIVGTDGDDVIVGTPRADIIHAGSGGDRICALGGDDFVSGETGNNVIDGGEGIDTIYAGAGSYFGGDEDWEGDDEPDSDLAGYRNWAWGGPEKDYIYGSDGVDHLSGDAGDDIIDGWKSRPDTCVGGPGTDRIRHCERELEGS
ncbi:MAG: calcium-binding protein [Acidimicrobiia bacterium]